MFREMRGGLAGIVVMDRAVIVVMMMGGAHQVIDFMRDIESTRERIPAHLHRKALQGKEQHQQNAKKSTHVKMAPQEPIGYTRRNFLASSRGQIKNSGIFSIPSATERFMLFIAAEQKNHCAADFAMTRLLKTLLLWFLIASLPLKGMAAVDAACVRVSHPAPSTGLHQQHDGNILAAGASIVPAAADSQHCVKQESGHHGLQSKGADCRGAACFTGAVAPPLRIAPATLQTVSEAVNLLPIESFTGYIPDGIDRPPRHIRA